ncbi:MAG: chlorite dismutase family protein [SAR202 cluster bacterium]|nr:chlorite dismutase family protein [SAR202 cluster bacterium]
MAQNTPSFVRYSFLKAEPEWRRLPALERERGRAEFEAVVEEFAPRMEMHSYSLMGTRGDVDFMLWQISPSLEMLQELWVRAAGTGLGAYLTTPHSFLAMTRPSQYVGGHSHQGQTHHTGSIKPKGDPYLFIYPFWKTHDWYQLASEKRQEIMNQHFTVGHRYPSVKIHTTYAFGLDDPEFVLGFESASPEDFVRLVMELRESTARPYTLRDTPVFTCVKTPLRECLQALG